MKTLRTNTRRETDGFTLVEMMVSTAILTVVIAGTLTLFISFLRSYNATTLLRNTSARSSFALERMVYGVGTNMGLREATASDVSVTYPSGGWKIAYTNLFFQYTTNTVKITDQSGKTICTNVIYSTVSNYTTGCRVWVTVAESAGGRTITNAMSSYVQFRN
jgi:prepilin-type N-terminal cleavage/methylation domain-containing protein